MIHGITAVIMIPGTMIHGITIPSIADSTCPLDGDGDIIPFTIQDITATGDGDILTMEVTGADTAMDTGMDTTVEATTEVTTVEVITIRAIITEVTITTPDMHTPMQEELHGMATVCILLTGLRRKLQQRATITTGQGAVHLQQTVVI